RKSSLAVNFDVAQLDILHVAQAVRAHRAEHAGFGVCVLAFGRLYGGALPRSPALAPGLPIFMFSIAWPGTPLMMEPRRATALDHTRLSITRLSVPTGIRSGARRSRRSSVLRPKSRCCGKGCGRSPGIG